MKTFIQRIRLLSVWVVVWLVHTSAALGQGNDSLVGIWVADEGFQTVEFLFRSDGRFQLDQKPKDPFGVGLVERGTYVVNGQALTATPYDRFTEPQPKRYEFQVNRDVLILNRLDFPQTQEFQLQPGSRADVLARENVAPALIGSWGRNIVFFGRVEYTFRPGGYYSEKRIQEGNQFPPEFVRGRYQEDGDQLILHPYSGIASTNEMDFFGNTLTLIKDEETFGESATYEKIPGSEAEVRAKAAEAEAFLSRENWLVGLWEIRDSFYTNDLTFRPDGHYSATNHNEFLRGIVRGRYILQPERIQLLPFIGQDLYSRDNGEFGKVARTRALDYYDGELHIIDLEALSQSVILARKRPGSEALVLEKATAAQTERAREGWEIGIWEVNDPNGWMEFTFRPDGRYIAKSGAAGIPGEVERGRYLVRGEKITLAPYILRVPSRGFELDLYDGELFLAGDSSRLVVARKVAGSESEVIQKTNDPDATKGERGSILGLWTANMPGQYVELVFRPDGQFRLDRCQFDAISQDYGLYSVNMAERKLVYDSRFVIADTRRLDFYGDTLTIHDGLADPSTYKVNLGMVDAAINASLAADAAETQVDAQWLARVPVGPRDPNAVQVPIGNIPADPNPGLIFPSPTVLSNYQLYRRLIPGFVFFNVIGDIRSVAVTHTREWHFFPTGRVLVRFRNYRAGPVYPTTVEDISDSWGAYRLEPKSNQNDILHIYADNVVFTRSDLGEEAEMTLEDGRRNLFWGKDYQILSEWATERKPIPCQLPGNPDSSLINNGLSLSTQIEPDDFGDAGPIRISLTGPVTGNFTISGTADAAGSFVVERTSSLTHPISWEPLQTNTVAAGALFNFLIPQGTNAAAYFRLRAQ